MNITYHVLTERACRTRPPTRFAANDNAISFTLRHEGGMTRPRPPGPVSRLHLLVLLVGLNCLSQVPRDWCDNLRLSLPYRFCPNIDIRLLVGSVGVPEVYAGARSSVQKSDARACTSAHSVGSAGARLSCVYAHPRPTRYLWTMKSCRQASYPRSSGRRQQSHGDSADNGAMVIFACNAI